MNPRSAEESQPKVVAALSLVLLAVLGVMPPSLALGWRLLPGLASLLLVLWGWRQPGPSQGLAVMIAALSLSAGVGLLWQVAMPLALLVLFWATNKRPALMLPRFHRGRVPVAGTLFCALVTPLALSAWFYFLEPDVSDLTRMIPKLSVWMLLLGALAFAFFNALFEECVWRGVIQERLTLLWGAPLAIALQAFSFGLAHTWGFPRGAVGVLLAGSWALMLGALRRASGGLLAPLLAHIVADASIAALLLRWL